MPLCKLSVSRDSQDYHQDRTDMKETTEARDGDGEA